MKAQLVNYSPKYQWKGYQGDTFRLSQTSKFIKQSLISNIDPHQSWIIGKGGVSYLNIPSSLDIETSSWTDENDRKHACMYIWQLGVNGSVIYGREWSEFFYVLNELVDYLDLSLKRRLIIYVHNLSYEFQFIKDRFTWNTIFAPKNRRPIYALSTTGIEFRCSYFLSNYGLAYLGDNMLHKYPVKKMVGDLDYSKLRNSKTPLTEKELGYCINDVKVVMSYIQEKIEHDGGITQLPLTNTGYVRNYCREECFYSDAKTDEDKQRVLVDYRATMKALVVQNDKEYYQLKRAFMGGFTHANAMHANQVLTNVGSADLTSDYPYQMLAKYYPMSRSRYIGNVDNIHLFNSLLNKYCCVFEVRFENLTPAVEFENILSLHRCKTEGRVVVNNGRIVSAETCLTTLTELDWENVSYFYDWDSFTITNLRIYERGYLPKALINAVLDLYQAKTELKGVEGKEVEYLVSKGMINAAFGMMVTNIVRDEYIYDNHAWSKVLADVDSQLTGYNKNFNRFLYYGWGVWVTAHARHSLFSAIKEFGEDYVYADTDSIKGLNFDKHQQYFEDYNYSVVKELLKMCNHYNIPYERCRPKTKEGVPKLIGVWDMERPYTRFKTCGAKRYMFEYDDGWINFTVSGVNKVTAMPYLLDEYGKKGCLELAQRAYKGDKEAKKELLSMNIPHEGLFFIFEHGMFIPEGFTGKNTLTYIDSLDNGTLVDYLGNEATYVEFSSVHMAPQSYYMSQTGEYLKWLDRMSDWDLEDI